MLNDPKLYGEISPGVFEFRIGFKNHNPFAAHWYGRYLMIERLTEPQLNALHGRELSAGQVLQPGSIREFMGLPPLPPESEDRIKAIKQYLTENMIDEMDRRCVEAEGCGRFSWFGRYPHLVRKFGMLHAMDWKVVKEKLPLAMLPRLAVVSEVENVRKRYGND